MCHRGEPVKIRQPWAPSDITSCMTAASAVPTHLCLWAQTKLWFPQIPPPLPLPPNPRKQTRPSPCASLQQWTTSSPPHTSPEHNLRSRVAICTSGGKLLFLQRATRSALCHLKDSLWLRRVNHSATWRLTHLVKKKKKKGVVNTDSQAVN